MGPPPGWPARRRGATVHCAQRAGGGGLRAL